MSDLTKVLSKSEVRKIDPCSGVSEAIGTVLLIALVVAAISLVAVILFSQQAPQEIPNLNFMVGSNANQTTLYLYHNGGDSLSLGQFRVLVDSVPKPASVSDGSNQWSLGKNLVVPNVTPGIHTVQVVYLPQGTSSPTTGGGVLIGQASSNVVTTGTIAPNQQPYLDCSPVQNEACASQIPDAIIKTQYKERTESERISFMKQQTGGGLLGKNQLSYTPSLRVVVSDDTESKIVISKTGNNCGQADTEIPLHSGDIVTITFQKDTPAFFILYGMAPQIWEMAGSAWVNIIYKNGNTPYSSPSGNGDLICHTWVKSYSDLQSTLVVQGSDTQQTETSLVVNKTLVINGLDSKTVRLANFTPTTTDVYLVESVSSGQSSVYFIGWAGGGIYFNGVLQSGLGL